MKLPLLFITLLIQFGVFAQTNIAPGEKLVFDASYTISGLLTNIAQVSMETSRVETSKTALMRLKCTARTYSKWDSFFKIDDLYESYVSLNSMTPYLYKREINEGGYYKFMQYKFNRSAGNIESTMKKKRSDGTIWEDKKTLPLTANKLDIVSTLYRLRTLDIDKAPIGASDTFDVLFDNKIIKVSFKLLAKETLNTAIGSKLCYKIAISTDTNLLDKNSNLIWLTADQNKVPVFAKFKIPVGNGELKLKSANGLKY